MTPLVGLENFLSNSLPFVVHFLLPATQGLPNVTSGQPSLMVKSVGVSFGKSNIFDLLISYSFVA